MHIIDWCKAFGVKENQHFRIVGKGTYNIFRVRNNEIECFIISTGKWVLQSMACLDNIKWIEPLPIYADLTEREKKILSLFPSWAKYIARDEDGTLAIYGEKPEISEDAYLCTDQCADLSIVKDDFQFVTFESGAVEIATLK